MSPNPTAVGVVAVLGARGQTLATAESLTGGLIGAVITSVPGASAVYLGGVISYATTMKAVLAGVPEAVLRAHGPVSAETAVALAIGVQERTGSDWALSATGVAGPDPQDGHAPGEVWLGLAAPGGAGLARRIDCTGGRENVRTATVAAALELLLQELQPDT